MARPCDVQTEAWLQREEEACARGHCAYANMKSDKPEARPGECHGWHGQRVQSMRDGVVVSDCIRHRRCPNFVAWLAAASARKAAREGVAA